MKQLDKTLKPFLKFEYLDPPYDVSKSISQLPSHIHVPGDNRIYLINLVYYRWGDIHLDHT